MLGENIYPEPLSKLLCWLKKVELTQLPFILREDRRHIRYNDLTKYKKNNSKIPLNLEMAPTKEMLKYCT